MTRSCWERENPPQFTTLSLPYYDERESNSFLLEGEVKWDKNRSLFLLYSRYSHLSLTFGNILLQEGLIEESRMYWTEWEVMDGTGTSNHGRKKKICLH